MKPEIRWEYLIVRGTVHSNSFPGGTGECAQLGASLLGLGPLCSSHLLALALASGGRAPQSLQGRGGPFWRWMEVSTGRLLVPAAPVLGDNVKVSWSRGWSLC